MKWVLLLDEILLKKEETNFLTMLEAKEIGASEKVGIKNTAVLDDALKFFSNSGIIVHFDSTEALKNLIVIQPDWLIFSIGKVTLKSSLDMYCEFRKKV
mmetsp:Transcript_935/g.1170  ORF Transcript_935/g.1170 Transcript_935/m.1170 type:complete len:99 (-) Transcript_935:12-308(-)